MRGRLLARAVEGAQGQVRRPVAHVPGRPPERLALVQRAQLAAALGAVVAERQVDEGLRAQAAQLDADLVEPVPAHARLERHQVGQAVAAVGARGAPHGRLRPWCGAPTRRPRARSTCRWRCASFGSAANRPISSVEVVGLEVDVGVDLDDHVDVVAQRRGGRAGSRRGRAPCGGRRPATPRGRPPGARGPGSRRARRPGRRARRACRRSTRRRRSPTRRAAGPGRRSPRASRRRLASSLRAGVTTA